MDDEMVKSLWRDLFIKYEYNLFLNNISDNYPDEKSIFIDFNHLRKFSEALEELTMNDPERSITLAEFAAKEIAGREDISKINIRFKNIPDDMVREIRSIRSKNIGELIAIDGIVRQVTEVRPKIVKASFMCLSCGGINEKFQDSDILETPSVCEVCGKKRGETKFKLIEKESVFIDTQRIEVQENTEDVRGGEQPHRIVVYLEDDLTGITVPGDRVRITGILKTKQRPGKTQNTTFDVYIHAISIEAMKDDYKSIEITEDELIKIKELAKDPDIYEKLTRKIASSIYGMDILKEALLLQLFGGVTTRKSDGTRLRGDIHILLVGDPGTGKSQILRYIHNIAPKSIFTSGKGSSAAGLTAAATKDEMGEGRWTLEAGALVLADNGIAIIDEIDKMDDKDRSAMHEAMEQQTITVSKAGMNATLMARCSILAAANPKYGRFDISKPLADQINLPPTLLSRFDAIFTITDIPGNKDEEIANKILEMRSNFEEEIVNDEIDDNIFRKYIAYARKNINPKISREASEILKDYFIKMRSLYNKTKVVPITPRQLEALIRLTQASARVRLSKIATEEDARRAIRIIQQFLEQTALTEEGIIDIDKAQSNLDHKTRKVSEIIEDIIKSITETGRDAEINEIIKEASIEGIDEKTVRETISKLLASNNLFEPRPNRYRFVE
ncbi:MAG: minichromosome maintenance protein MCM [Thermoplasmata archaeon]